MELGMGKMEQNYKPAFITRLHARYTKASFPQDLEFKETESTETFQGRYIIRHPWKGPIKCSNPRCGVWGEQSGGGFGGFIRPSG